MAFIVGSLIIGTGATLAGAAISSSGAKSAAKTAAAGSEREIAFNRESRDLARSDQAPYREAGYTALDALMSMTGLKGTGGGVMNPRPQTWGAVSNVGTRNVGGGGWGAGNRGSSYRTQLRYDGGPMEPDTVYNVHELGNENIYAKGSYTRGHGPATIDGRTGYVEPNTRGMANGGFMGERPFGGNVKLPNPNIPMTSGPPNVGPAVNPSTGYPNENPGGVEGGYNFMTEPGYQFRVSEGIRASDRSAAARGGLLSGGYARQLTRYGQDYASNEFSNVYNRISNIAGLGQTSANASGNYAMHAGQGMGNAASNAANASAYGQIQSGNAWANAGNEIAKLPWGKVFGEQ